MNTLLPKKIKQGDTIGIIAPSRPIYNIDDKIKAGIKTLQALGYKVVLGKNLQKQFYTQLQHILPYRGIRRQGRTPTALSVLVPSVGKPIAQAQLKGNVCP